MPLSPTPVSSVVHVSPADTGSARVSVPVVTIALEPRVLRAERRGVDLFRASQTRAATT